MALQPNHTVPRTVFAAPKEDQLQVQFYQACGLPESWVKALHNGGVDRALIRGAFQWRLDYPLPKSSALSRNQQVVIAVAQSLLTRGTTPPCLPTLEECVDTEDHPVSASALESALVELLRKPSSPFVPTHFESEEERLFHSFFRQWQSAQAWWSVLPQVYHTSLSAEGGNERVDFLLVSTSGDILVVEIDGAQHSQQRSKDQSRDQFLANLGIQTVRVPASEVRSGHGPQLTRLQGLLAKTPTQSGDHIHPPLASSLRLFKFLHQVQLASLQALQTGWLSWHEPWIIRCDIPSAFDNPEEVGAQAQKAIKGLVELLGRLSKLYGADFSVASTSVVGGNELEPSIHLVFQDGQENVKAQETIVPAFYISDIIFPGEMAAPTQSSYPATVAEPSKDDVRWFLSYVFRKDDFWEGQWETIKRTLQGKDSVVLLPTGSGKSIAFQLAALLLPGPCIVVDPIIALIDDQIDNLRSVGIDRSIGITSQMRSSKEREQVLDAFASGNYLFCYVAPERFQSKPFRERLRALTVMSPVSLIAVDEAHCVSVWGHDFRTSYLNLGRVSREYCSFGGTAPPLVALTGTASKIVLKDVQRDLGITDIDAVITPRSFDRPELRFSILRCSDSEKTSRVLGFLNRMPFEFGMSRSSFFQPAADKTASGLIFCPFANSEYGVAQNAKDLSKALGIPVTCYSGRAPRGYESGWNELKQTNATRFKRNQDPLMVCTKAYGMGIDKPNVRYTVHINLPESIESFYQEAGRAGRDKQRAECAIVVSNDHPSRSERLLSPNTTLEEIVTGTKSIPRQERDDVVRALWFHLQAFRGEEVELKDIKGTIERLEPLDQRRTVHLADRGNSHTLSGDNGDVSQNTEKALHKLVVIGAVDDYTVEWFGHQQKEFDVRLSGATQREMVAAYSAYVASYQQGLGSKAKEDAGRLIGLDHERFVLELSRLLVQLLYAHVEKARRRSLHEMLLAATQTRTGEELRARVLDYLEHFEFDERLDAIISSVAGGLDHLEHLLDDLVSPNDAAALRGTVARQLTSYPDNPGLLLLRAITEVLSQDGDFAIATDNLKAGIDAALGPYRIDPGLVAAASGQIAACALKKPGAIESFVDTMIASGFQSRDMVRLALSELPEEVSWVPASWLMSDLALNIQQMLDDKRSVIDD